MIEPCKALRRYPLFALLSRDWLDAWLRSAETCALETGQSIFAVGGAGTHVYLILSGKVRLCFGGAGGREISVGTLRAGEVFGEYALLAPGLNTATCRAAEAGQLLRLPLPPLRQRITELLEGRSRLKNWLRLHYLLAHLRELPSLGFMSATSFLPLLDRFETVRVLAGNTIQTEGLHDDGWFVIQSGRACVLDEDDKDEGKEVGPGDCFGEAALSGLVGIPTVQAVSDVQCLVLRRSALDRRAGAASLVSVQTHLSSVPAAGQGHEWVVQREENDCGVAALAMVARAHGRSLCMEDLRERTQVQKQGTSLLELQRAARQLGFHAHAVRISLDHLAAVRLPAIAHMRDGHYVTLFELSAGNVVVGDPATGVGRWTLSALQRSWTGHLLLITTA